MISGTIRTSCGIGAPREVAVVCTFFSSSFVPLVMDRVMTEEPELAEGISSSTMVYRGLAASTEMEEGNEGEDPDGVDRRTAEDEGGPRALKGRTEVGGVKYPGG